MEAPTKVALLGIADAIVARSEAPDHYVNPMFQAETVVKVASILSEFVEGKQ